MTVAEIPEFPGFNVRKLLVHGRRGPIFEGVRASGGQLVAIHLVDVELSRAQRQRFREEATALRKLPALPHVTPVLDAAVTVTGEPYVVTPAARHTLGDRLRRGGPLPVDAVVAAGLAAVAGLDALHAAGQLHGNLTPGNLLVARDGTVSLTGMALPVLAELDAAAQRVHHPPEVLEGGDWTVAADVYSLAHALWELLAGSSPFRRPDDPDFLHRLRTDPLPDLARGDVDDALRRALRRGLDPRPDARPASAGALLAGIRHPAGDRAEAPTVRPDASVVPADRRFGSRYVLVELIARGGMGEVWRGVETASRRPVAIKRLQGQFARDHTLVGRLIREADALKGVAHPHLVNVHGFVAEGDDRGLVMDLVDGHDLRRVMGADWPSPPAVCTILAHVAGGLAAVHSVGVVHRDVKPENILVRQTSSGPYAQLTDFGIVRLENGPALTLPDQFVGTPEYAAPEVFRHQRATAAADVYSLGVVAYELFARRRPDAARPRAGAARPPGMPEDLWRLVRACLDPDPEQRPAAAKLATALVPLARTLAAWGVAERPAAERPAPRLPKTEPVGTGPASTVPASTPQSTARTASAEPSTAADGPERRRPRLLAVLLITALAGGLLGLLVAPWGTPESEAAPPTTATPNGSRLVETDVRLLATSPRTGEVRLRFLHGDDVPVVEYTVSRVEKGEPAQPVRFAARDVTVSDRADLDPAVTYCYRATALVPAAEAATSPAGQTPHVVCVEPNGESVLEESQAQATRGEHL